MNTVLGPIEWVVSWIMVTFHSLLTAVGMDRNGGLTWGLSIVGLVIVIRTLLIPLFVKQIRSQRGMQMLQPRIKELQARHKGDREKLSQETMKLYKETGTNPLASCLPLLLQSPVFFALYRVLRAVSKGQALGVFRDHPHLLASASDARLFNAPISAAFLHPGTTGSATAVHVVSAVLIVLMSGSMFFTQRQLMTKNMPPSALEGPFAQQQKLMLYLFPAIFLVTGVNFPIGVLIYWFTTNVWSMFQQLVVIARMPSPGSVAHERLERKRREKAGSSTATTSGGSTAMTVVAPPPVSETPVRGQRQQPKRNAKNARTGGDPGAKRPPGSGASRTPDPESPATEAS